MEKLTFLKKPKIFLPLFILMAIIIGIVIYLLLPKQITPEVEIINQSKSYQLRYESSPYFTSFLRDLNKSTRTQVANVRTIRKIQLVINDQKIPNPSGSNTFPLLPVIDQNKSKSGTIVLNIGIDESLANKFDFVTLNTLTVNTLISLIYSTAYPSIQNEERYKIINSYIKEINEQKLRPFTLTKL